MNAFEILGEPVRRRIVELLATGELAAGEVGEVVQDEFAISQPAVSAHLRVLRENGFASVRADGNRRLYSVEHTRLREIDEWLAPYRRFWSQRLDALEVEVARGKRTARQRPSNQAKEERSA
jgi:DNA-binding transcriptional ArsR family regulator